MEPAAYIEMDRIERRHWWFRGKRRLVAPLIARMIATAPNKESPPSILEIGCGTGGNLAHFGPLYPQATFIGLDFDTDAARFSAQKILVAGTILQADGVRLPFAPASLDGALALDIIEHFEDDAALCRELARVLKPGGDLVLSVPAWPSLWSPHDDFLHHKRRYTPTKLRALIESSGFDIQETRGFNFLLWPVIWLLRRLKRKHPQAQQQAPSGTDFFDLPRSIGALLASIFVVEAALLHVLPIRFGVSIMLRAKKRALP